MTKNVFQGSLFISDFLTQSIANNSDWKSISDEAIDQFQSKLSEIYATFPTN